MRGHLAISLASVAVALACESRTNSNDGAGTTGGAASSNGGSASNAGSTSTGGASGTATAGLGGTNSGAGSGNSGTSTLGGTSSGTGGTSGIGPGGSDGTGDGGERSWSCRETDSGCTCGPVTEPNVDACAPNWPCCFTYATDIDGVSQEVCACGDLADPFCTEQVNGLYRGRRETSCPP